LDPGLPPGYEGFGSNAIDNQGACVHYGECNAQVTTDASCGPAGPNARGFRIYLEEDCWPTGENILRKDLGAGHQLLYLRWYQRESTTDFANFQKLFRLKQPSGQVLIPEWQVDGNALRMNLWDVNSGNRFFDGYDLRTDYVPGTWVSYEIKIDIVAQQAEFWVDGVSRGSFTNPAWSTSWAIRYVEVGGNQYGHSWSAPVEQYRDYDDIVVSSAPVGPGSGCSEPGDGGVPDGGITDGGDPDGGGGGSADAGGSGGGSGGNAGAAGVGGSPPGVEEGGGCGCFVRPSSDRAWLASGLVAALWLRRRRRS